MNGTFGIIRDIDESILILNPLIEKDGYEFIKIGLDELEGIFRPLLSIQATPLLVNKINVGGSNVSEDFYMAYLRSLYAPLSITGIDSLERPNYYILLIKKENQSTPISYFDLFKEMDNYGLTLIAKLRLFKESSIEYLHSYQYYESPMSIGPIGVEVRQRHIYLPFAITFDEIEEIRKVINYEFSKWELPIKYFELSYKTSFIEINFLNLITALECLFNKGPNQISHTIARHLSLIVSKNVEEFKTNYSNIKKLYELRSRTVHGGAANKDFELIKGKIYETREYVRKALKFVLLKNFNKDELFEHLNAKGYDL